jgi:hypothetical protein
VTFDTNLDVIELTDEDEDKPMEQDGDSDGSGEEGPSSGYDTPDFVQESSYESINTPEDEHDTCDEPLTHSLSNVLEDGVESPDLPFVSDQESTIISDKADSIDEEHSSSELQRQLEEVVYHSPPVEYHCE